jgi:tetratricopeptide (TPR) repeat protein
MQDNHPSTAKTLHNIGLVKDCQDEYKKALDFILKALKINEKVFGDNHPSTEDCLKSIGIVNNNQGEYKEALDYYNKALKIY